MKWSEFSKLDRATRLSNLDEYVSDLDYVRDFEEATAEELKTALAELVKKDDPNYRNIRRAIQERITKLEV